MGAAQTDARLAVLRAVKIYSAGVLYENKQTVRHAAGALRRNCCCVCRAVSGFGAEYIVGVTLGCFLANLLGSTVIDVVFGTLATLLACLVTYKLRDVRVKGLAIPASLPPVVFNMLIVGAFEITFFFSDAAPTVALAAFNAVAVGIGEIISCTVVGVALVKLVESNEGLKRIFTEK